jgi:MFS family permease
MSSWMFLCVILLINIGSQWQRFAIAYVKGFEGDPLSHEHDNSHYEIDKEFPQFNDYYGFVSGPLFLLPMAISGIFMGILIDRYNRKCLLVFFSLVWSSATFFTGYLKSFPALFVMRFLLGVAESVCNPAAYSLIREYFPPSHRATANAIYSSGIYVGTAISSISIIIINEFGWRGSFMFTGILGAIFGTLGAIILREPERPQNKVVKIQES